MKRLVKKNQIMIATLAVMIAVAGYLSYSDSMFGQKEETQETSTDLATQDLLDISMEDGTYADNGEIESLDQELADNEVEGTPGEAVLTSGSMIVAEAKVSREQVRAKNKEMLMGIIDNENLADAQKEQAVQQMVELTELAEAEVTVETLLASKGFTDVVVSLTADSADIVVKSKELTDANRAQIEDIVTRKTGVAPENIVITPLNE